MAWGAGGKGSRSRKGVSTGRNALPPLPPLPPLLLPLLPLPLAARSAVQGSSAPAEAQKPRLKSVRLFIMSPR
jgi:hypothetical protein